MCARADSTIYYPCGCNRHVDPSLAVLDFSVMSNSWKCLGMVMKVLGTGNFHKCAVSVGTGRILLRLDKPRSLGSFISV